MMNQISQTTLNNGLTIVTDHAPHLNAAAIQVTVKVGSMYESDAQSGIAHLIEHLIFRGSAARSGDDLRAAFERLGGEINGMTDEDTTVYTAKLLYENVPEALALFGEMISAPRFDPEDITLEQQIVEQENCNGCWTCTMRETFLDSAYPGHGAARPIIGDVKTVNALTREDIVAFHKAAYQSGAVVVTVAGNVDHEEIVRAVGESFATLPGGAGLVAERLAFEGGEAHLASGSEEGVLRIGYGQELRRGREDRATALWMDIVAGHGFSHLMQELREKRGLVYGVWGSPLGIGNSEILSLEVRAEASKMAEVVKAMAEVMWAATREISEADVKGARQRVRSSRLMDLDDAVQRCRIIAENVVYFGDGGDPEGSLAEYLEITAEEIAVAGAALMAQPLVILSYGPKRVMPRLKDMRAAFKAKPKKRGLFRLAG